MLDFLPKGLQASEFGQLMSKKAVQEYIGNATGEGIKASKDGTQEQAAKPPNDLLLICICTLLRKFSRKYQGELMSMLGQSALVYIDTKKN